MTTRTTQLCKIFIGPAAAAAIDTQGEFEGLSWTAIGQVLDLGDFGDSSNIITADYLDTGRTEKYKGTNDAGTMSLKFGFEYSDAGQAALIAAQGQPDNYAFKVTLNDASAGSPSAPTTFYFRGQVMTQKIGVGAANKIVELSADVAVNSAIIRIAAV